MKPYWQFNNSANGIGELYIYGEIVSHQWEDTETSTKSFKDQLDALGDIKTLNLYINSPGGNVFEGVAIYNMLKRHKAKIIVHIDALAASIASVIAMAGDKIVMPSNSMMMIHNPWAGPIWGNSAELHKAADDLDRIRTSIVQSYMDRVSANINEPKLLDLLNAETWLSAQECLAYGFCDEVGTANQAAALIEGEVFAKYRNVPKAIISKVVADHSVLTTEERQRIISNTESEIKQLRADLNVLRIMKEMDSGEYFK